MSKAVLSNRIFMDCTPELQESIDKELTYKIPSWNADEPPQVIKNMGIIKKGLITIPIGRTDLIPEDYEIVDKRLSIEADFPEFRFELRESQQQVYDEIEDNDQARVEDNRAEHEGVVAVERAVHKLTTEAGDLKNRLNDE